MAEGQAATIARAATPAAQVSAPSAGLMSSAPDDVDALDSLFWVGVLRDVTAGVLILLYVTHRLLDAIESTAIWATLAAIPALLAVIAPYAGRPLGLHRHPTGMRITRILLLTPLMALGLTGFVQNWLAPGIWGAGSHLALGAAALGASSGDRVLGKGRAWWLTWASLCLSFAALLAFVGFVQAVNGLALSSLYLLYIVVDAAVGLAFIAAGVCALMGSLRLWAAAVVITVLTATVGPLTYGLQFTAASRTALLLGLAFASALPALRRRRPTGFKDGDRRRAIQAATVAGIVYVSAHAFPFLVTDLIRGQVPASSVFFILTFMVIVIGGGGAAILWSAVPHRGWIASVAWAALCLPVSVGYLFYSAAFHHPGNAIRVMGDYSWLGMAGLVLAAAVLGATLVARFAPPTTAARRAA
jgi:hypothetical protein